MTRAQRIAIGAVVLATLLAAAWCVRRGKQPSTWAAKRDDRSRRELERSARDEPVEPDEPNDPDEPEVFDGSRAGGFSSSAVDAAPAPTPTKSLAAAPPGAGPRVQRLHANVLQQAVRAKWVTIDDSGTPCPPDRIRIVYVPPANLKQYRKGAYFTPLGPAPSESTDEVNGLLLCEGSSFLYRGFEAYFRADSGRWEIFPFPVIEE